MRADQGENRDRQNILNIISQRHYSATADCDTGHIVLQDRANSGSMGHEIRSGQGSNL